MQGAEGAACVGVLLAGGEARRFGGRPKGLATIGGVRIADRVLAALRDVTDSQLVVSNDAHAPAWFPGIPVVSDAHAGLGPLAGIETALLAAGGSAVLVVAWDMPYVTSALLRRIRMLGETGVLAAVPSHGTPPRLEPLCAYYAAGALAVCSSLLVGGERRAHALHDALPLTLLVSEQQLRDVGDPVQLFLSVDDENELQRLGGRSP